ncbi:hypothetical protein PsYK624_154280 [Phanerochaete sordida]|uniref:Uncharacterized protein n=1 Tax=Phanerochaete sordida TaxID=48140 RepID=A0A9P3GT54_9APHY|nr:hypothetical protein PsYK624_154280 [Phanerochaete sordida]
MSNAIPIVHRAFVAQTSMIPSPSRHRTTHIPHTILACTGSAPLPLCKAQRPRTARSCVLRPLLDRIADTRPSVISTAVIDKDGTARL